jgi:hypothetical protein
MSEPIKVKNRTNRLVIIPLNSGESVHLGPGKSQEIEDFELENNVRVEKLLAANLIAKPPAAPRRKAQTTSSHPRNAKRKQSVSAKAKPATNAKAGDSRKGRPA